MTKQAQVKFTANLERNLDVLESFWSEADAPHAFGALLDELADTVVPNFERFPDMGCLFMERPVRSVEVSNSFNALRKKLKDANLDSGLRAEKALRKVRQYTPLLRQWKSQLRKIASIKNRFPLNLCR